MHRCSRIVALASRHVEAITPAGRAYVSRRKGGGKACEPRKKIGHFHVFVLLLQSPTQIALKCVSHQVSTTTHLSRGTLTCAHFWSTHVTAPVRARGRSERVGARRTGRRAVLRHATRRCGVRAGMVCGRGRLGERAGQRRLPHTSMTKLASAFACFGRENQRTIPRPAPTITTRPAVSCAESRSRCILRSWFPPTFFSLSRSTHSGTTGAVLGMHDWPSDGAGARLGARWRFRPCAKSVGKPLF